MYYLGVDLGGTNIKAALVDADGAIIKEASTPTKLPRPAEAVCDDIAALCNQLAQGQLVAGIGVGCPGTVDGGIVRYSNNLDWHDFAMGDYLRAKTGLPVALANDANAAALGEALAGCAKGAESAVIITLGTGVGGGVVLGGIDFYPKKRVGVITDVTRRFYSNWDEKKYRHYLELFAIDESKRVDQLSSGMKVKYMIALALSHGAELLLLDEPTSGLDPVSRDELVELFRHIVADGTRSILFSTHITSDLEKCASHIAFIKDGEMLYNGGAADFRERFRDKGETMEDIIVAVERRELDDSAII